MPIRCLFLLLTCTCFAAAQDQPLPASFETAAENPFVALGGAQAVLSDEQATLGAHALKVSVKGSAQDSWPGVQLRFNPPADWTLVKEVRFDLYVAGDEPLELSYRIDSADGRKFFSGKQFAPGWTKAAAYLPAAVKDEVDLTQVTGLLLYLRLPRQDRTFYLDNLHWVVETRADPNRIASFETDDDQPLVAGGGAKVERVEQHASEGQWSLKVFLPGAQEDTWPGVTLRGGDRETLTPGAHYADNNYLHHIGVLNGHGHGVRLDGVGLRVSHNLIHDITRSSIFGGGNDCVVEYNHIRHDNLVTEDTAGFYTGGNWHVRGYVVRYNFVHDIFGYGRRQGNWVSRFFSFGIYLDDDHSGAQVYGNIVARVPGGGVYVHAGRDNLVENNIIVDCTQRQFVMSGHDPKYHQWLIEKHKAAFQKYQHNPAYAKYPAVPAMDPETAWRMVGNQFRRNVVSYRGADAKLYGRTADPYDSENPSDHNLIWHHGQPITINQTGPKDVPKEQTWEQWRERGFDRNSVVADPLFVDPDNDDYRLRPDSPAYKLGFKPIPVEKIGPYRHELRATWPIVEAEGARELPPPSARVLLWPDRAPVGDGTDEITDVPMSVYLPAPAKATGAAVVICPGGGYMRHVLQKEGAPVAHWLARNGIAGIVLEYRLPRGRCMVPLLDAQRAIRMVRANAKQWNLDPQRIGIMGFSAGGHLASTAVTHFDAGDPQAKDPISRESCRPDFGILIYPVVTMGEKTHGGSKTNLLGDAPKPELIELFSNEKQVTDRTPPTFLAHAQDDKPVPPDNSRMLRDALLAHKVPVEYLELPSGGHGLGRPQTPMWEAWKTASLQWLAARGIISLRGAPIP